MTQRVNIIKADRNTSLEVFEKLSRLDRMLLPEEGWSAESFRSEAEKENGCVLYIMENNCIARADRILCCWRGRYNKCCGSPRLPEKRTCKAAYRGIRQNSAKGYGKHIS